MRKEKKYFPYKGPGWKWAKKGGKIVGEGTTGLGWYGLARGRTFKKKRPRDKRKTPGKR